MKNISISSANVFLPVFLFVYVGLSMMAGILVSGMDIPYAGLVIISELTLILPVAVFLFVKKADLLHMDFMAAPKLMDIVMSYLFAYTLMPLIYFINIITMTFTDNPVNDMMGSLYDYNLFTQLLLVAVLPAVVEEFIFRGVFYTAYRKRNILGAALMSGLIFGMIHLNINQCAYAVVMGVVFALLVEATGSIVNSIAAHFAFNANSVFMLAFLKMQSSYEEYSMAAEQTSSAMQEAGITGIPIAAYAVLMAFAVGGAAIAVCLLRKMAQRNGRERHMAEVFKNGLTDMTPGTDRFFDIWSIIAIFSAAAYMIVTM